MRIILSLTSSSSQRPLMHFHFYGFFGLRESSPLKPNLIPNTKKNFFLKNTYLQIFKIIIALSNLHKQTHRHIHTHLLSLYLQVTFFSNIEVQKDTYLDFCPFTQCFAFFSKLSPYFHYYSPFSKITMPLSRNPFKTRMILGRKAEEGGGTFFNASTVSLVASVRGGIVNARARLCGIMIQDHLLLLFFWWPEKEKRNIKV